MESERQCDIYSESTLTNNLKPFASLVSVCLKRLIYFILRKIQILKMTRSGKIIEKPHFAHSFTVILALIIHHAPTSVKWSIEVPTNLRIWTVFFWDYVLLIKNGVLL